MVQVNDLAKYLLNKEPQKSAERLAFYHFIKNCRRLDEPLTPQVIDHFVRRALSFPHWQTHASQLWEELRTILSEYHQECGLPFHPNAVVPLPEYEVFQVQNLTNLSQVIETYLAPHLGSKDQFRVVWDGRDRVVAVHMGAQRELDLAIYSKLVFIRKGQLVPLREDQILHYGPDLEPRWDIEQTLEVSPYVTARFALNRGRASGYFVRGYTFQKVDAFEDIPIDQCPALFYPLKRIESLILNRERDPYYQEIVTLLEHAGQMLATRDPEAFRLGTIAFEKGQTALDHVFVEDRVLGLLLKDLARTLDASKGQLPQTLSL